MLNREPEENFERMEDLLQRVGDWSRYRLIDCPRNRSIWSPRNAERAV